MPDPARMQRAPVDGGHVEYALHGSGDPMLFIHGAGIADAFLPLVDLPPLAGVQQIHYRRRGYGHSTAAGGPENFMARAAADAAQLLAHLRADPAHVVGHSSGALVALDLACHAPHAVRSLALLEPPLLSVPSTGTHMAALTPAVERYAAGDRAGAIDGLFSLVFGPGWRQAADRAVPGGAEQAVADAATFFESELPGVGAWQFDSRRAELVRQPVLFMMGSATLPFHKEAGARIREWWPDSEHDVVPGATHALQVVEPSGVANGLAQFIARH